MREGEEERIQAQNDYMKKTQEETGLNYQEKQEKENNQRKKEFIQARVNEYLKTGNITKKEATNWAEAEFEEIYG